MQSVGEIIEQMSAAEVDERNANLAYQIGFYDALSGKPRQDFFVAQYQANYERGYEQGLSELPEGK